MARPYHINLDAEDKANALLVNGFVDDTAAGSPTIYRSDVYPADFIFFRRDGEGKLINVAPPTTLKVFAGELDAAPTGGTFTISSDTETTAAIAYNASAATVQTAVRAALVTDFSNATVTGPNGGPWVITAVNAGPLAYDIEVDPTALSPVQSTAQVINTEGDADHDMQWEVSLFRAYPMFRGSGWSALPSAAVSVDILQVGAANANKVYEVSWNRDAYEGAITLSVLADAVTGSVGPFPFNATADEIKDAFEAHPNIETDEVTVKQTDVGEYTITFSGGSLANSNSPTISTSSDSLDVPVGLRGTLAVATHGANQILNGETEATIAFEVEIQENTGEPETVVHIEDAILKADGIHNNPGQSTGNENYPQLENVLWANTTITEYIGGDAEDLDSIATVDRSTGQYIAFAHATDGLRFYELISSTDAESSPTTIRPDDYNGTTNQKVWRLQTQDATNITTGTLTMASGTSIKLPAGSAGTPALNFGNSSSDINTGLYWISADSMGFSAGGTLRATFDTTGIFLASGNKFGVGTSTIGTNGHVRVMGSSTYGQVFVDPSTSGGLTIQGTGGGGFVVSNGNWDGSNWSARITGPAAFFGANNDGGIRFYTAASVTAGSNFSPVQTFEIFSDKTSILTNDFALAKTITAGGTTGAQTIDKTSGSVNFAAAASSLVVTNNKVTTSSVIIATVATNDATMKTVLAVAAAGSFTLHANAAATAETRVNWIVTN